MGLRERKARLAGPEMLVSTLDYKDGKVTAPVWKWQGDERLEEMLKTIWYCFGGKIKRVSQFFLKCLSVIHPSVHPVIHVLSTMYVEY